MNCISCLGTAIFLGHPVPGSGIILTPIPLGIGIGRVQKNLGFPTRTEFCDLNSVEPEQNTEFQNLDSVEPEPDTEF